MSQPRPIGNRKTTKFRRKRLPGYNFGLTTALKELARLEADVAELAASAGNTFPSVQWFRKLKDDRQMAAGSTRLSPAALLLGFLAAAIAVVTVHQAIVYVLALYKFLPATAQAWSMQEIKTAPGFVTAAFQAMGFKGLPQIVNSIFWGGLWGVVFAAVWPRLPGGAMWLRGLIFGLLVALLSNWILVPFIKGVLFKLPNQPFFAGFDPTRMLATGLILGGFGLTLGLVYGLINSRN
jgi:hypothetical protein